MCYLDTTRRDTRGQCRYDKCCNIPSLKTCYIFAIFNVVTACLWWLACVGIWSFLVSNLITIGWIKRNVSELLPRWMLTYLTYAVANVAVAVWGVFAVLLVQGVRKKKPKLVMAYLIFGLIVEAVMIMGFSIYISIMFFNRRKLGHDYYFLYGVLALAVFVCVVYGFILCLVRNTHLILLSKNITQNMDEQTVLHLHVLEDNIT